jgi:hypothetical protein
MIAWLLQPHIVAEGTTGGMFAVVFTFYGITP